MTIAEDPQQVWQLAQDTIRKAAEYPEYWKWCFRALLQDQLGLDYQTMPADEYHALWEAVRTQMEIATITVGRSDGQPYPGQPGDGWWDREDDLWVHCSDGIMRVIDQGFREFDPVDLDIEWGPMRTVNEDIEPQEAPEVDNSQEASS